MEKRSRFNFDSPFLREESIKKKANKSERKTAQRLGIRRQPRSGAGNRKGDFSGYISSNIARRHFIADEKSTKYASIKITKEMIDKVKEDMYEMQAQEWAIPLVLQGNLVGVIISPDLFKEITNIE